MRRELFARLLDRRPAFAADVLRDVATRFCVTVQNLKAVGFRDVKSRLADLLLDYAALAGESREDGVRIRTKLTQDGMAKDLAVTRKAINATLRSFKADGLIGKAEGRYLLKDMDALRALGSGAVLRTYSIR